MIQNGPGLIFTTPAALAKHVNFLFSGVAGAAKTTLLGTIGKGNKALIADVEGGTVTYQSAYFRQHPQAANIEDLHILGFDDVTTAQDLVHRVESALDYLIRTGNKDGYTLFALDSVTEFQEKFLSLHQAADKRQSYGALRDALYSIVHKARQAPLHTAFTARLKATTDEVLNREIVRPEVSPGVWSVISGLFDNIGFLDLKVQGVTQTRVLDFAHKVRTQGKDRYGLGELTNPTFVDIVARLTGEGEPAAAAKPIPVRPAARAAAARR